MKVLKTIRLRGSDMMPGCDMSHGLVDRALLVPFERLERKGASRSAGLEAKGSRRKAQGKSSIRLEAGRVESKRRKAQGQRQKGALCPRWNSSAG